MTSEEERKHFNESFSIFKEQFKSNRAAKGCEIPEDVLWGIYYSGYVSGSVATHLTYLTRDEWYKKLGVGPYYKKGTVEKTALSN